jgi:DNA-binding XRE family transcriptional regulator
MIPKTLQHEMLAMVVSHPAFVALRQESQGVYVLTLYDPLNRLWETTGSLQWCIARALQELPLEGWSLFWNTRGASWKAGSARESCPLTPAHIARPKFFLLPRFAKYDTILAYLHNTLRLFPVMRTAMGQHDDQPSVFGTRVKRAREQRGLTQRALAALAQTSYSTIWRIETGAMPGPSITVAARIAEALNVSLDVLAGRYTERALVAAEPHEPPR